MSLKRGEVALRPKPKPRREREVWVWEPSVTVRGGKLLLRINSEIPFLRGQWLLPGTARQVKVKPKKYDYRHSITHHDIYVTVASPLSKLKAQDKWVLMQEIRQYVPASLVQKALDHVARSDDRAVRTLEQKATKGKARRHSGK